MDVSAEKVDGLDATDPFTKRRAAGMLACCKFIETRIERRKMDDEIERLCAVERGERFGDFFFRKFSGSVEGGDVAVAKAGPLGCAVFGSERPELAMEIDEAEAAAEFARVVVAFVIAGKHPYFFAEWFQNFATAIEILAERGEVACGDIDVCGLRDDFIEGANIAVNIAEDQNFHGATA